MKNCTVMLLSSAILAFAVPVHADDPAQEALERVKKKYEQMDDAEVRFSQKAKFPLAKLEQEMTGTLLFKKTNKYRVEFEGQLIVTNGETVWSYSEQNNQVLIDKFKLNDRSFSPERVLTASPEDYMATLVGREKAPKGEAIVLKLIPRDPSSLLKSMKLWVHDADWLIHRVELLDQHGKETTYKVFSFKTNVHVADSSFVYHVPPGVEVVDLRD